MGAASATRRSLAWARVRDSLWFAPSVAVLAGVVLSILAVRLPAPASSSWIVSGFLFGGGAEGARGVLSAIAGSLITVTGTVFSVTIVALQLASSQFTPRLLGSFVADRLNQVVLGIFIGTFTYTLLVLRTIHSAASDRESFVPRVAVSLAMVLLLVSIGALIVFINHSAQSIRAAVILHRETQRTLALIDTLFPERIGEPDPAPPAPPAQPEGAPATVRAGEAGYLQAVHAEALWALGGDRGAITVQMELHIGGFAIPGLPLASVWPADAVDDDVVRAIRHAFVLGSERTAEQDVEFGIVELSDIAVKALSPGINDPTTAIQCIDRLTQVLGALGTRGAPSASRLSPDGTVHLRTRDTSFERAMGVAFDQIRHYGADSPAIVKKLLDSLAALSGLVGMEERRVVVAAAGAVVRAARRAITDPQELEAIERLATRVTATGDDGRA